MAIRHLLDRAGGYDMAPPPISPSNGYFGTNLVPIVRSISCFVPDPGQPSTIAFCTRIILGNIALFLPFGFLFPLVFTERQSWKSVALARSWFQSPSR